MKTTKLKKEVGDVTEILELYICELAKISGRSVSPAWTAVFAKKIVKYFHKKTVKKVSKNDK